MTKKCHVELRTRQAWNLIGIYKENRRVGVRKPRMGHAGEENHLNNEGSITWNKKRFYLINLITSDVMQYVKLQATKQHIIYIY